MSCFEANKIQPRESDEEQRVKINQNLQSIENCVGSSVRYDRVSPPSVKDQTTVALSESGSGVRTAGTSSDRKLLLMSQPVYHTAKVNNILMGAEYDGSNDNYFFDMFAWEMDPATETFTSDNRMHLVDNAELTDASSKSLSDVSNRGGLVYDLQSQFTFSPGIYVFGMIFHSRVNNGGSDGNTIYPATPGSRQLAFPQYHAGYVDNTTVSDFDGGNDTYKVFFNSRDFGSSDGNFNNSYSTSRDGAEFGYFPYFELVRTSSNLVQWDASFSCSYDLGAGEYKHTGEVCSSESAGDVIFYIKCGDKVSRSSPISFSSANNNCTTYEEVLPIQSSAPSSPSTGDRYINSGNNGLYKYDGSSWNLEFTLDDTCSSFAVFILDTGQEEGYGPCDAFGFTSGSGGSSGSDTGGADDDINQSSVEST